MLNAVDNKCSWAGSAPAEAGIKPKPEMGSKFLAQDQSGSVMSGLRPTT